MIATDIIVSRTMVTDNNEFNEVIARFFEVGNRDLTTALTTIGTACHGIPSIDPMTDPALVVYHLIANGFTHMVPTSGYNNVFHLETQEIHVEVVIGINEYSKHQLFDELLITYEDGIRHIVISGHDLLTMDNKKPFRSRKGYIEAAALRARDKE